MGLRTAHDLRAVTRGGHFHRDSVGEPRRQGMSWRVVRGSSQVGSRRIRFQTRLAGTERRCTPTLLWQTQSQASGNTVASTMRLPVPNTGFGRPWCCQLHVPPAKCICGLTLSLVRAPTKPKFELLPDQFRTLAREVAPPFERG